MKHTLTIVFFMLISQLSLAELTEPEKEFIRQDIAPLLNRPSDTPSTLEELEYLGQVTAAGIVTPSSNTNWSSCGLYVTPPEGYVITAYIMIPVCNGFNFNYRPGGYKNSTLATIPVIGQTYTVCHKTNLPSGWVVVNNITSRDCSKPKWEEAPAYVIKHIDG